MSYLINDNFHTLAGIIKDGSNHQVILIAGEAKTGKHTLAKRLAEDITKNTGVPVVVNPATSFLGLDWSQTYKKIRSVIDENRLAGAITILVANSGSSSSWTRLFLEQASLGIECLPGYKFHATKCRDSNVNTVFRRVVKADLGIEQSC